MRLMPESEIPLGQVAQLVLGIPVKTAKEVDKSQLAIGILVEMEHTDDPKEAETIARTHLDEDGQYYAKPMKKGWGADEAKDRIEELAKEAGATTATSRAIVDRIMQKNTVTQYELATEFGISVAQADVILRALAPTAFGPGGKGYAWFVGQVDRLLAGKTVRQASGASGAKSMGLPLGESKFPCPYCNQEVLVDVTTELGKGPWGSKCPHCHEMLSLHFDGGYDMGLTDRPIRSPFPEGQKAASVFVFEDDPERIGIFRKAFGEGNVVATSNVGEALGLLRTCSFSRIYLDRDVSNPKENGEDLAWQMEQEKLASSTPVVIHSENTRGQRVMARYLGKYHSNVTVTPFRQLRRQLDIPGAQI
jgi:ribosomal protein S25